MSLTCWLGVSGQGLAQTPVSAPGKPAPVTAPATAEGLASDKVPSHEADGSPFQVEDGTLYAARGGARAAVTLPGPVVAIHVVGNHAYVALGELGAAVVRAEGAGAAIVERIVPVAYGAVTGFMVQGDAVWMQVSSASAIRLHAAGGKAGPAVSGQVAPLGPLPDAAMASPPATPAGQGSSPAPKSVLHIVKVFDGKVLLDAGKTAGLRAGDRLKVVRPEHGSDAGGEFDAETEVAVLVVDSVGDDSARARIWRGDRVQLADRVEVADKNTYPSLVYPRAQENFAEAEVHLRPILNIGDTGFGALVEANVTYYGESVFAGLRSQPLGMGRTQGSTAFTQTLLAEGGYTSRPFAIGLGLGFTSVYGDLKNMFELTASDSAGLGEAVWDSSQPETTDWRQEMQHTFALEQRVRLGALDGLSLTVSNTLLYFGGEDAATDGDEPAKAGFIWGATQAKLTVPLAMNADLFVEGGGGVMGYAFGAVGVFGWLNGNGGPGSLGLLASAGGAGVWGVRTRDNLRYGYTETQDTVVAGPTVSLGLRYRFGVGGAQ